MATARQIEANRRNSQLSTGPRTQAGKSASRMNALKSGMHSRSLVIFDESIADLEALIREYFDRFQPATPEERALVDTLANAEWILRRLRRIEPELWHSVIHLNDRRAAPMQTDTPLAFVYRSIDKELDRLQIRINSFDRTYHRALNDLTRLQKERKAAEAAQISPIGFVSKNPNLPRVSQPLTPDPGSLTPASPNSPHSVVDFYDKKVL